MKGYDELFLKKQEYKKFLEKIAPALKWISWIVLALSVKLGGIIGVGIVLSLIGLLHKHEIKGFFND